MNLQILYSLWSWYLYVEEYYWRLIYTDKIHVLKCQIFWNYNIFLFEQLIIFKFFLIFRIKSG